MEPNKQTPAPRLDEWKSNQAAIEKLAVTGSVDGLMFPGGSLNALQITLRKLVAKNQRMWDLLRHQRCELFTEKLITTEEYDALAADHAAVKRLEDYDAARTRIARLEQERGDLLQVVRSAEECLRHQPCCHIEADWVASCSNISQNARDSIAKIEASR